MLSAFDVGTVGQWALVCIGLFVAWRLSRGGAGAAVHELSEANRVLERRVQELGAEVRDLKAENVELRSRTDFAAVIALHEDRALERHERVIDVLGLIADRLGPEPPEAPA